MFEVKLKDTIQKLPFQKILTLKNVQTVVNEADGYQPHIIAPENGYRCGYGNVKGAAAQMCWKKR